MNHNALIMEMTKYYNGQPHRVQHFMKVYAYSKMIGELEGLSDREQDILEVAAIVHDIGIKVSEEKYGDCIGKHQEEEGPAVAQEMLEELSYDAELTERVCYLVGHHHTYKDIAKLDYQILVEADFLVNLFENETNNRPAKVTFEKIFKTKTGKEIGQAMFATDREVEWEKVGGFLK